MKVTYFLEVVSSWCYWAEPTWAKLQARYAGRVHFSWKIAQMNAGDYAASPEQCDWFHRRSGLIMRSPFMLNSGWVEPVAPNTFAAPNLVAEAARDFGFNGDEIRLALSHAALREGKKILRMEVAAAVAAKAGGKKLNAKKLRARAESAYVRTRVETTTREFHALQVTQRPAFVIEDSIGDRAVFSGLVHLEPLAATIDAMFADTAAYTTHAAHFGKPPGA